MFEPPAVDPARVEEAIESLPVAHATALRLRGDGLTDEAIAVTLGIEVDAVRAVVEIAEAKLAHRLTASGEPLQTNDQG
jgi:DNA-directed RNA polymerase specialized sigma24 family protein